MPNLVTTLNPYKSGWEWTFEALPVPKAVEKQSGSIAPLRAELWPSKEGNHQICLKIDANVTDFVTTF